MRCYKLIAINPEINEFPCATRYAATNALARETREALMQEFDVHKKDVEIVQVEIPVAKAELLEFINGLCSKTDK